MAAFITTGCVVVQFWFYCEVLMAFFKADTNLAKERKPESVVTVNKLRYVVGTDGKGYWLKPTFTFDNNYDKELPF